MNSCIEISLQKEYTSGNTEDSRLMTNMSVVMDSRAKEMRTSGNATGPFVYRNRYNRPRLYNKMTSTHGRNRRGHKTGERQINRLRPPSPQHSFPSMPAPRTNLAEMFGGNMRFDLPPPPYDFDPSIPPPPFYAPNGPLMVPPKQAAALPTVTTPPPAFSPPLNVHDLFQRLLETGILPNLSKKETKVEEKKPETELTKLHSGLQCSTCGDRFPPEKAERYSDHLDWHFRQNRKERDAPVLRNWFYDINDWIHQEEIENPLASVSNYFEAEKQKRQTETQERQQDATPSVPAHSIYNSDTCEVCYEKFEHYYNDTDDAWHVRPAVMFEDKYFHPLCLEDYKV